MAEQLQAALAQNDEFDRRVMAELREQVDGTTHFALYLASLLRDLSPEDRMDTEMELLNIVFAKCQLARSRREQAD